MTWWPTTIGTTRGSRLGITRRSMAPATPGHGRPGPTTGIGVGDGTRGGTIPGTITTITIGTTRLGGLCSTAGRAMGDRCRCIAASPPTVRRATTTTLRGRPHRAHVPRAATTRPHRQPTEPDASLATAPTVLNARRAPSPVRATAASPRSATTAPRPAAQWATAQWAAARLAVAVRRWAAVTPWAAAAGRWVAVVAVALSADVDNPRPHTPMIFNIWCKLT